MTNYPIKGLTIDITDKCHHDCMHCSTNAGPGGTTELADEIVLDVVREFRRMPGETKSLSLSGGEPFLRWGLVERVLDSTPDIAVSVFTTGHPLGWEELKLLVRHREHVALHLSLYSDLADLHDHITRTPGSHERTINSTKLLKDHSLYVGWHFPLLSLNRGDFIRTLLLAADLGVDMVSVLRLVPQGRAKDFHSLRVPDRYLSDFVELLYRLSKSFQGTQIRAGCPINFFFLFDSKEKPKKCKAGCTEALIEPDGRVIPCAAFKGLDYCAGNITQASFQEIWNYSDLFAFLRTLRAKPLVGKCNGCRFGLSCKGRCLAQRIIHYGDYQVGPDPICPLRFRDDAECQTGRHAVRHTVTAQEIRSL